MRNIRSFPPMSVQLSMPVDALAPHLLLRRNAAAFSSVSFLADRGCGLSVSMGWSCYPILVANTENASDVPGRFLMAKLPRYQAAIVQPGLSLEISQSGINAVDPPSLSVSTSGRIAATADKR